MILASRNGGIAQLGERLHGMQEVSGSIPLTSTKFRKVRCSSPGSPSSRGLGHHPFTVSTGVRIPVGTPRIWQYSSQAVQGAALSGFLIGGIAQLGERLHGMQEVSGSIPLTSTKFLRSPSSRGLGHHPFTVSTGVRIPVGTPVKDRSRPPAHAERCSGFSFAQSDSVSGWSGSIDSSLDVRNAS